MRIETGSSNYKATSNVSYIANKGDTAASISKGTGAPLSEILRLNPKLKDANQALPAGTEVMMPLPKPDPGKAPAQRRPDGTFKEDFRTDYPKADHSAPAHRTPAPATYGAPPRPDGPKIDLPATPPNRQEPAKPASRSADTAVQDSMARQRLSQARPAAPAQPEPQKDLADHAVEKNKWVGGLRDTLDATKGSIDLKIESLTQRATGLKTNLASLAESAAEVETRMGLVVGEIAHTTNPAELERLQGGLRKLADEGTSLKRQIQAGLAQVDDLAKESKQLQKISGKMTPVVENLCNTKKIATGLGRLAIPLDVYSNFQDFEKANPGHSGQNMLKATVTVATKLAADLKTAGSLVNVRETAVGALKCVMEIAGLKDTPAYDAVDLASQAFPVDVAGKVVANFVDLGFAGADYAKGDAKAMDRLLDANLQGTNGQVIQGVAILGDLMLTGGQNIPTNDEALKMAYLFQNPGHTEVPLERTGRTGREKAAILDQVMDGAATAPTDVVRIQNIVAQSTPDQLKTVFERHSPESLVRSLPSSSQVKDPVTTTFLDLAHIAAMSSAGQPQAPVWGQLDRFLQEAQRAGKTEVFAQLRERLEHGQLKQLPGWLRQNIRHGY